MNRTEKKCIIASAGIHLLLLLIMLVGPAFLSSSPKVDNSPILEFIPIITTDLKASGGGDPTVKDLPAAQPQPQPQPPAPVPPPVQRVPDRQAAPPEPVKAPEKPAPVKDPEPDALEVSRKPPKVQVNLKVVKRPTNTADQSKARAEQARQQAAAARRLSERLDKAVSGIKGGLSGSTEIRLKGPGGGGVPYANFYDAVKAVYARAWRVPDDASDDSATAVASVVIAKDGTVLSARIIKSSGNAAVDRSVRSTLENVRFAAPLPATETASQREVTINFNVRAAKLLLG